MKGKSYGPFCFKLPHKKVTRVKSGERAVDKTRQFLPIEEAIDKMQQD
jgi:hypothetical protein